jgi:DNA-directed RNA polymerase specialized sigma24 family protein
MRLKDSINEERSTAAECRALFLQEAAQFRLLCDILTADEQRSRSSFDDAAHRSMESAAGVFREYILPWTRRMVIKACIRAMWTEIQNLARRFSPAMAPAFPDRVRPEPAYQVTLKALKGELVYLDALSRFVFVMRVLENYSRRETALLLGIDEITCAAALSSTRRLIPEHLNSSMTAQSATTA